MRLFVNKYPDYHIINVDKLTYAGNLANLKDIENKPNYTFVKADICDFETITGIFKKYKVDGVIHLAAESHVDRSIKDPFTFAQTNVMGTLSMLQAAKLTWEQLPEKWEGKRFYHISTDEVYGALELTGGVAALRLAPEGLHFVLASALLAWGGLCVHVQGLSALAEAGLPLRPYLGGKLVQTGFAVGIALLFQQFLRIS